MQLVYGTGDAGFDSGYANGAGANWNGNITMIRYKTASQANRQVVGYFYDTQDRLTAAKSGEQNSSGGYTNAGRYNTAYTYDGNGNILTLQRKAYLGGAIQQIDQLGYSYSNGGDRLQDITESAPCTTYRDKGFKYYNPTGADYGYDAAGNMTYDPSKGLTITYNHLNLPRRFDFGSGKLIDITYDATGQKLTQLVKQGTTTLSTVNYAGGIEYRGAALEAIYHADGRLTPNGTAYFYEYTLKDHLGNSRVSFRANGTSVITLQENHYYPFGLEQELPNLPAITGVENRYQYNSKELIEDWGLNLVDSRTFGVGALKVSRWYDPATGRWGAVDPLAEKYHSYSPFSYAMNNPILFLDPNGMDNIIYLLVLQGADKDVNIDDLVKSANLLFSTLGLKTQVSVFKGNDFDISKIDPTDGVAILGSDKKQIGDFAEKSMAGKIDESAYRTLTDKNAKEGSSFRTSGDEWPEVSENPGNAGGRITAIDGSTLNRWEKSLKTSSKGEAGAFFLFHGAGHQAGISHKGGGFMAEGGYITDLINNPRNPTNSIYDLVTCHENFSSQYAEKMKKRFQPQNQSPKANYPKR